MRAEPRWSDLARRLVVHARALGASHEQAEDLVADALERVMRDPTWHDPSRGTLLTALKVVVRSRYLNLIRASGVRDRAAPRLRLVGEGDRPDRALEAGRAADARRRLLACLTPEERALFRAWIAQRGGLVGSEAAASVGLDNRAYEAAKKRLRRRIRGAMDELGLAPEDLFGTRSHEELG